MPECAVSLQPYTQERCHAFWKGYVPDPAMWEGAYTYDAANVDGYYRDKVQAAGRRFFAICHGETTVGEIQLKRIDLVQGCATMSIHLACDAYKNRGWGTLAEALLIDWAKEALSLRTLYADCVLRNLRSQHVLEKNGFAFTHEEGGLRYYMRNL